MYIQNPYFASRKLEVIARYTFIAKIVDVSIYKRIHTRGRSLTKKGRFAVEAMGGYDG